MCYRMENVNMDKSDHDEVCEAEECSNHSETNFGKMYITPFPFCAVFLSDDDDSTTALFSISPIIAGKTFNVNKMKRI